ncbi:hypothetical protein [Nocardioides kongjuensis]|uniref:Uncharacterized protein n=2 Tax=Nocardioides kongjuensis TaxID=349522 RepID=A0A852RGC7_9ACTN|nr:hypothetical protein [Nocardioides kongjuensis]NYD32397.1 hypothetical protein [Nocardioides kongjuensis]
MGNHSAVRRRPPDLGQVLARMLAVLFVVAVAVVLGLLLTGRDVPPPEVTAPPRASTAPAAGPVPIEDAERAAVLSAAATATEQVVEQVADPNALMTPRYARIYRRTVGSDADPAAHATVVGTGLVGIDREQADVLVLLDRTDAEPENVLVHLRRDRGSWRVDDLAPLTAPAEHLDEPDPTRGDLLAAATQAAAQEVAGEVLAAGVATYDTTTASVLAVTEDQRLRVAMRLVDGTWRAKVSALEPVSAD